MKKNVLFFVFFLFSSFLFSQNEKVIDSLKLELKKTKTPLEKAKINYNLGLEFINTNYSKCDGYFIKVEEILSKIKKKNELTIKFYYSKGLLYRNKNEYNTSDSLYTISSHYANKHFIKADYYKLNSLNGKALNLFYRGKLKKSLFLISRIEEMFNRIKKKGKTFQKLILTTYRTKGIVLATQGNFTTALFYFKKVVDYREQHYNLKNKESVILYINAISNIALCYDMLNKPKKAINAFLVSLELARKIKDIDQIENINIGLSNFYLNQVDDNKAIHYAKNAIGKNSNHNFYAYNNIGAAYLNLNKSKESNEYLFKAMELGLKMNRPTELAIVYTNLGLNFIKFKNYNKALVYLKKGLQIYSKFNITDKINLINVSIAKCYIYLKKFRKALPFMKKAETYLNNSINLQNISNKDNYYRYYEFNKKYKLALLWLNRKQLLVSKLDSIRNYNEVKNIETKYQTKQKETEILKLSNQNNKQKAQLAQSRLINISGALVLLLLSGLGLFFWHKRKQQQKLAILESTVKTSEEEKQRIGKELHDGIAGSIMKLVYETEGTQLDISTKLLKTYNEVRNLSHQLDNTTMHNELFIDRVLELVPDKFKDKIFTISINPSHLKLEEPYGTHFYRIIQELITNNLKHAKATKTSFKLTQKKDKIVFTYKDDGVGIKKLKKGGGFKNIEDRVELMHGKLNFKLENEKGVELSFLIPYKKDK